MIFRLIGRPVKQAIRDALGDPEIARRSAVRMERFLGQFADALTADKAPWFDTAAEFSRRSAQNALQRFETSFDRWRDLFDAAERQLNDAHRIISDHSTGSKELRAAKDRHRQAANQLELLKSRSEAQSADFYTYRYLATEGFLPGYNFPRLPLLAYVPGAQDSIRKQTFLQRARFVGISEFGPRSLVYHEGRAFRVVKAMISSVGPCGRRRAACHPGHRDVPGVWCSARGGVTRNGVMLAEPSLADAFLIRDVFRIANVETIPAERISINDEERQRQGFDLQTLFAWASQKRPSRRA